MKEPVLDSRYKVVNRLGTGGMAVVYRARDSRLLRDVAVKVLDTSAVGDNGVILFHREARAIAALRHTNIVQLYDYSGPDEKPPYLVMELIDGNTLDLIIEKRQPIPEPVIVSVLVGLAAALAHAHQQGVIHRDVKPGNVLLESTTGRVLLTDFGIAKAFRDPQLLGKTVQMKHTGLRGTPMFMAPEQVLDEEIGPATDVFSFGAVAYCLAVGRSPFSGSKDVVEVLTRIADAEYTHLINLRPDVGPTFDALVTACMAQNSKHRPTSAEIVTRCEAWLHERGVLNAQRCIAAFLAGGDTWVATTDRERQLTDTERAAVGLERTEIAAPHGSPAPRPQGAPVSKNAAPTQGSGKDLDRTRSMPRKPVPVTEPNAVVPPARAAARTWSRLLAAQPLILPTVVALLVALVSAVSVVVIRERREQATVTPEPAVTQAPVPPDTVVASSPPATDATPSPSPSPPLSPTLERPEETADAGDEGRDNSPSKKAPATKGVAAKKSVATTPALVEITVKPWGTVFVDGKELGNTPVLRSFPVAPGKHTLMVRHPTLGTNKSTITVRPGEHKVLTIDLKP